MKRRPRRKRDRSVEVIRLWARKEVLKAVPYIRGIVGSVRENWLDLCQAHRREELLMRRPGRQTRGGLLEHEELRRRSDRAADDLNDALNELAAMDVYCLDPVCGLALIPFRQEDELAWFVFDLFDPEGFSSWRYHHDPLEERRPMAEATQAG